MARSAAAIRCRATSTTSGTSASSPGLFLMIQIVTGIVLAMHYYSFVDGAFNSVEHIMRDVNAGWLLRYAHAERRELLLHRHLHPHLPRPLLRLLQGAARAGVDARPGHLPADDGDRLHGLRPPWGQMSYWGAQVITGFFSAFPVVGEPLRVLAARRLCARPGGADPLLLAPLSAAVRDRGRGRSCTSGRCTFRARATRPASTSRTRRTRCPSTRSTRPRTAGSASCC
jgi:hypothetical protein